MKTSGVGYLFNKRGSWHLGSGCPSLKLLLLKVQMLPHMEDGWECQSSSYVLFGSEIVMWARDHGNFL